MRGIMYIESEVRQMIELVEKIIDLMREIVSLATAIIILLKSIEKKGDE